MRILFVNSRFPSCGVYQYGYRLYNILKRNPNTVLEYCEISDYDTYISIVTKNPPYDRVVYNYHPGPLGWVNESNIHRQQQNIGIIHDCAPTFFDKIISPDPNVNGTNYFGIPRPIFEHVPTIDDCPGMPDDFRNFIQYHEEDNVPIIGSFGFGIENKGFHRIIEMTNQQYDRAIIKLLITRGEFMPSQYTDHALNICRNIPHKDGIHLMIHEQFVDDQSLLVFLSSNTINLFLYDTLDGRGISSTIDYAMSVKKPIGISDSCMFRNIYNDSICLYKNRIDHCIQHSVEYCKPFLQLYSSENLFRTFESILAA